MAILEGFVGNIHPNDDLLRRSAIAQIAEMKTRLHRYQAVLDVLSKQTNNLISKVFIPMTSALRRKCNLCGRSTIQWLFTKALP